MGQLRKESLMGTFVSTELVAGLLAPVLLSSPQALFGSVLFMLSVGVVTNRDNYLRKSVSKNITPTVRCANCVFVQYCAISG